MSEQKIDTKALAKKVFDMFIPSFEELNEAWDGKEVLGFDGKPIDDSEYWPEVEKRLWGVFRKCSFQKYGFPEVTPEWQEVKNQIIELGRGSGYPNIFDILNSIKKKVAKLLDISEDECFNPNLTYNTDGKLFTYTVMAKVCAACNLPFNFLVPAFINCSSEYYFSRSAFEPTCNPLTLHERKYFDLRYYKKEVFDYLRRLKREDLIYVETEEEFEEYGCPMPGRMKDMSHPCRY